MRRERVREVGSEPGRWDEMGGLVRCQGRNWLHHGRGVNWYISSTKTVTVGRLEAVVWCGHGCSLGDGRMGLGRGGREARR